MKVQFLAVFWTLALAVPLTALALVGLAYFTDNLAEIATWINWRGVALEGSARWPELAGMTAGQILILAMLLIAQRDKTHYVKSP